MRGPGRLFRGYSLAFLTLASLFLILGLISIDRSCLDASDSAYLISADAISRGLMPYRDFLAAHPPLLFLLGAPLAWLKAGVLPFRIFSVVIAAGTGLVAWRLSGRLTGNSHIAFLAGALALFAPLGVFFSKLFLSDSLVSLLGMGTLFLLMYGTRRATAGAGALAVLGMLTKLTYLPLFLLAIAYLAIYKREQLKLFVIVALGGTAASVLVLEALTHGVYLADILWAQASKGYSLGNLRGGLGRIWQMDWPLLVPAAAGLFYAVREWRRAAIPGRSRLSRGNLFLLLGWLAAGVVLLATLPAEGHDTNLFQAAEPAVALLAAWGIIALATSGRFLAVMATLWLALAVSFMAVKDREFFTRSNADFVAETVAGIQDITPGGEGILAPGCYAIEADRPVIHNFYDQFLWEEKYKRSDEDALILFDQLRVEAGAADIPAVILDRNSPTYDMLTTSLKANYALKATSPVGPPVTFWLRLPNAPQPCG